MDKSQVKVLGLGYLTVALFIVAYLVIHWFAGSTLINVDGQPAAIEKAAAAVVLVSPILLALVWGRLSKVKVGPVEISLSEVSTEGITSLAQEIREVQESPAGPSLLPDILKRIREAVERLDPGAVLEVDLGEGRSWWATRLYLLAALAEDYTQIRALLFVSAEVGGKRFLALAEPQGVRKALAGRYPYVDSAYRKARAGVANEGAKHLEVEAVVQDYGIQLSQLKPANLVNHEAELRNAGEIEWISPALVGRLFSSTSAAVEWDGGPTTPLLLYRVLDREAEFVALIEGGKLRRLVDRYKLGVKTAKSCLGPSAYSRPSRQKVGAST